MDPMEGLAQPYFIIWQSIFLNTIALIYFWSFYCFHKEILGLVGSQGIYPLKMVLESFRDHQGWKLYYHVPTLFWVNSSDQFIKGVTLLGQLLAILILLNVFPSICFFLLWIIYFSLRNVCPISMIAHYESLLLEVGFLAIFFSILTPPPTLLVYVAWFYLFRLMFGTGIYKLLYGVRVWRTLDALSVHLETQPQPTRLAYYLVKCTSPTFLKILTALTLVIQILVPFLIWGPQKARLIAGFLIALSQFFIALSGNFAFFNVLAIAMCIPLLMDVNPNFFYSGWVVEPITDYHPWLTPILSFVALLLFIKQLKMLYLTLLDKKESMQPNFGIATFYGMYSHFPEEHYEIRIEGSHDGIHWQTYESRDRAEVYKPLRWIPNPFFSRFESILSSAGGITYHHHGWITHLIIRLLEGSASVGALFLYNPFKKQAPKFVRCNLERLCFSDCKTQRQIRHWWKKTPLGPYCTIFYLARHVVPKKTRKKGPRPLAPFYSVQKPGTFSKY